MTISGIAGGYPCFVISIAMIGVCTAVIGDVASHLGCFIFLKDSVNAIAFVALGTSVPGTSKRKRKSPVLPSLPKLVGHTERYQPMRQLTTEMKTL